MLMGNYKPPDFTAKFIERTKVARETGGFETAKDMAKALGIPVPTYRKYEERSPMPHHLIPKFCSLTSISYQQLFGQVAQGGLGNVRNKTA